jgi:hypothetical protein
MHNDNKTHNNLKNSMEYIEKLTSFEQKTILVNWSKFTANSIKEFYKVDKCLSNEYIYFNYDKKIDFSLKLNWIHANINNLISIVEYFDYQDFKLKRKTSFKLNSVNFTIKKIINFPIIFAIKIINLMLKANIFNGQSDFLTKMSLRLERFKFEIYFTTMETNFPTLDKITKSEMKKNSEFDNYYLRENVRFLHNSDFN